MEKIKILMVDDHAIMRQGLRALLNLYDDIEVVGEASNGKEAITKTQELKPHVVLMDISMPLMNGIDATRHIVKHNPEVKVVIITQYDNREYLISSVKAGALGYLPKGCCGADLISAIRTVHHGDWFLHPSVFPDLIKDYLHQTMKDSHENLTVRELEVLRLVAEGQTSRQVADNLAISLKTVLTIRANIMKKLDLHNHFELFKYAVSKGLVKMDGRNGDS